ncbi:MAG: leucine-rich repeat domain-containing protein [Bacteroidales bacterium]|nr:leucine-rich repeat domain-containing protein [Bacteroidales bacterium]
MSVTYPGPNIDSAYTNYTKPTGDLVIPDVVSYNNHQYLVTAIESGAFAKCTGLTGKLELPYTITSIGSYAFFHCGNIEVLCFNCEQCTSAFAAFEGCNFDSIFLGNSVTVIPDGIFSNFNGITSIQIPASVQSIGVRAFYNCPNLHHIDFSDSVIRVGDYAFSDCPSLETIGVINTDTISDYAYWGCKYLHSITIGGNVKRIGDYAFFMASSVDTIFCLASTPPVIGENAFYNLPQDCVLIVNCDALDSYQLASGWSCFSNIVADHTFTLEAVANQEDFGYVIGSDDGLCYGEAVSVEAIPFDGYIFQDWSDGETNNPREIKVLSDTIVIAQFVIDSTLGIEEDMCSGELRVVTIGHAISVFPNYPTVIRVFDVVGRCLYISKTKEENCSITVPDSGVYVVVTEGNQIKKTVVGS